MNLPTFQKNSLPSQKKPIMPSLTSKLVRLVLKLKGIKKIFAHDPILYQKLRKEDIHQAPKRLLKGTNSSSFTLLKSKVTVVEAQQAPASNYLLLFFPGGAFVSGPNATAWLSLGTLVSKTGVTGWLVDYPKAPEHQLPEVGENVEAIYTKALEQYAPECIFLMGDSAGGQVILSLTQRLIQKGLPLPQQLIAVSPIMDMSVDNPAIAAVDPLDPMLSKAGVHSANQMAVGQGDLKDPQFSPLYGDFEGFPPVTIFLAEQDILYPDACLGVEKMKAAGVEVQDIVGKEMFHVWPFMPLMKEGVEALGQIEEVIVAGMTTPLPE